MSVADEQRRQSAVLALIRMAMSASPDADAEAVAAARLQADAAAWQAHAGHARALAARLLRTHFPTVSAMLGEDALTELARRLWLVHPPRCGDLGEWGGALPSFIDEQAELAEWPWLSDSARLDWAWHRCHRQPPVIAQTDSLHLLGQVEDADRLALALPTHAELVSSRWPIGGLWAAHRLPPDQQAAAARAALEQGTPEAVLVWHGVEGMAMLPLPPAEAHWTSALLASPSPALGSLLDAPPAGFDFSHWLTRCLQAGLPLSAQRL